MADLRIADAPEIALEDITGNEKIPTGGYGNSAVTINNLGQFAKTALSLATEAYVSNAVGQKENKITLTGVNLTPSSTYSDVPQTNNMILNTIHQDLLNRMEWIKDNVSVITDHQALQNRGVTNTHPSTAISHNVTSNVSIELETIKNDILRIETETIPEVSNQIVGKQDVIVNDVNLTATSALTAVPSTNNAALNSSLQALMNRDEFRSIHNNLSGRDVSGAHPASSISDGLETQKTINDLTVRRFDSIEDLISYNPRSNGQVVYVKSYYSGFGLGGGIFTYDSSKSSINDGVVIFNGWCRQLKDNTITSEMVGITSDSDSTAKLDTLAAFMNGKSYNLKLNGSISTTKAFVLLNLSNSKIEVDDLYFVPPATTSLSQNRGAITVRNSTNVTVRNSYLHGECVMYSADLEDGQAGIVFIDSTNCKACNNRIERFHTWGILASNCSNTLAFNNTINHITRQSGINIWHGNGVNNIEFDNTITNIGLYGVEFENGTGLNDKGFSKSSTISDCFQGVTLVNLIDNATIVDHEINRCYRGITYSLSVGTRKIKIADNKVNDCRMGMLHGMANVQSSRNTFIYSAQSFYKTSPYSSVDYFDLDGYVYVVDSSGKTNATTWNVGDSVQINGITYTISEVVTGVTISPYTFNFVKIKFSVNPSNLRVGDFILKPPVIDNVGVHFFSTAYIESQLDVIQGYATHYKESMTTTGNRRIKSPRIVDGATVFRFDNSLSNLNCKFYVDDMQITGDAQLVDNAHANSLASIRYLVSNGYVRPNGYYNLNYFKPVTYGSFSLITQGRRTLKAMRFIAVELEYIGLATSTGNPAILINDQNFELSLGKVATTTPTDGIGFTAVNPFNAVSYLNTFKLTNTSAANDLGYTSLQYKLFYI